MSEFKREDRYIVIKRSDLGKVPAGYWSSLIEPIGALRAHLPHRECLVIESDWPEYEVVWQMIERRMTGQPPVTAAEELDAVLHWRAKHTQAIRERDAAKETLDRWHELNLQREAKVEALQQRLNDADQWNDELLGLLRKAAEFEVGENDNEDWQHLLSQISLQLTQIRSLKPAEGGGDDA